MTSTTLEKSHRRWAVAIPLANEEETLKDFATALKDVLDKTPYGSVYFVVDTISVDKTREIGEALEKEDSRFHLVWAPQCRSVVDAYLTGFRAALEGGAEYIIEMDGGFSHDPKALPEFIKALESGAEVVWGSRVVKGGEFRAVPFKRRFLSWAGTLCSRVFLGTCLHDSTSGYEAFTAAVLRKLLDYKLHSTAHFYQTEVRYLLRNFAYKEVGIIYTSPSPRVSQKAIKNALKTLCFYTWQRLRGTPIAI